MATTPRPQVGFLADLEAPATQPALPGLESALETAVIDGIAMENVKAFLLRWLALEAQVADLRAVQRDLAAAMKAQGVPTRTATLAFRQLKQRRTLDSTLGVFAACQELFAPLLAEPAP
jgi:hypothetical protein